MPILAKKMNLTLLYIHNFCLLVGCPKMGALCCLFRASAKCHGASVNFPFWMLGSLLRSACVPAVFRKPVVVLVLCLCLYTFQTSKSALQNARLCIRLDSILHIHPYTMPSYHVVKFPSKYTQELQCYSIRRR